MDGFKNTVRIPEHDLHIAAFLRESLTDNRCCSGYCLRKHASEIRNDRSIQRFGSFRRNRCCTFEKEESNRNALPMKHINNLRFTRTVTIDEIGSGSPSKADIKIEFGLFLRLKPIIEPFLCDLAMGIVLCPRLQRCNAFRQF